jgi:hypothetical protein
VSAGVDQPAQYMDQADGKREGGQQDRLHCIHAT